MPEKFHLEDLQEKLESNCALTISEWNSFLDSKKYNNGNIHYSNALIGIFNKFSEQDLFSKIENKQANENDIGFGPLFTQLYLYFSENIFSILNTETQKINDCKVCNSEKLFYDFILKKSISGEIIIPQESKLDFFRALTKMQQYLLPTVEDSDGNIVNTEGVYTEISDPARWDFSLEKNNTKNTELKRIQDKIFGENATLDSEQKDGIRKIKVAYGMMKRLFQDEKRQEKEPGKNKFKGAFTHLTAVMDLVLEHTDTNHSREIKLDRVLVALLHDVLEDVPGVPVEIISDLFGEDIAKAVQLITKKPFETYLKDSEKEEFNELEKGTEKYKSFVKILKSRRNEEYYSQIQKLGEDAAKLAPDSPEHKALFVKLCDRMHNLSSMEEMSISHMLQKIEETEKYFLGTYEVIFSPALYKEIFSYYQQAKNQTKEKIEKTILEFQDNSIIIKKYFPELHKKIENLLEEK